MKLACRAAESRDGEIGAAARAFVRGGDGVAGRPAVRRGCQNSTAETRLRCGRGRRRFLVKAVAARDFRDVAAARRDGSVSTSGAGLAELEHSRPSRLVGGAGGSDARHSLRTSSRTSPAGGQDTQGRLRLEWRDAVKKGLFRIPATPGGAAARAPGGGRRHRWFYGRRDAATLAKAGSATGRDLLQNPERCAPRPGLCG